MADRACLLESSGLESGAPLIGLGILLLFSGTIAYLIQGEGAIPIVVVIFGAAGIFMLWAGLTK